MTAISERIYSNQLKSNMLFHGMNEDEIKDCLDALYARIKNYKKDMYILNAGDFTKDIGIVLDGSVTIERNDYWGNCTILSHIGKNGFFAETYALMKDTVLLVDVRANSDSRILFLEIGRLRGGIFPETSWKTKLTANLLAISIRKNLALSERNFNTAPKTIRGKLLSYLGAVSIRKQNREFDIPFDRQQLSDYLGVDRTALSKEIGKMRQEGILKCDRSHFVLLKSQDD